MYIASMNLRAAREKDYSKEPICGLIVIVRLADEMRDDEPRSIEYLPPYGTVQLDWMKDNDDERQHCFARHRGVGYVRV